MAREARYPAQISALVTQRTRDRIDALEKEHPVTGGDVIRDALDAGLRFVEEEYARRARDYDQSKETGVIEAMTDDEYAAWRDRRSDTEGASTH